MRRIGILGGTFDPPHIEHLNIIENVIKELGLSLIIVVPTFMPPHKFHSEGASAEDRVEMLRIALKERKISAQISDFEINAGGVSYTYKTVEYYKNLYDDAELFFIVGGDMLVDFKSWKEPSRILAAARLAVFDREGLKVDYDYEEKYFKENFKSSFIKLKYVGKNISSTNIRIYNMFGISLDGLTERSVAKYIQDNKLYLGNETTDIVRINLTSRRVKHTANVVICALKKSKELGLNREDIFTACALHDVAKYMNKDNFPRSVIPENMPHPVEHAYLGEYYARQKLGIKNNDVLNAIKYHTSGRAEMSALEKLVFVADMIEDGRDYDGVDKLRALYDEDFEKCFLECLFEEMSHLKNKKGNIFIETIKAYNYYLNEKKENI